MNRYVLDLKEYRPDHIMDMAGEAKIPEANREQVVDYIGREFNGLHEGNAIRYRLRPEDLVDCNL